MQFTLMTRFRDVTLTLLRIVAGFLFMPHGMQKLFGWFGGFGGQPGGTAELFSLMGLAGVLETFGGLLILLGLFTRPVAFILAGEMATAYLMAHQPRAPWPIENMGELPVLFCFIYLLLSANGPGSFSLDGLIARRNTTASDASGANRASEGVH